MEEYYYYYQLSYEDDYTKKPWHKTRPQTEEEENERVC